jgi:hypothetical protein
MLLVRFQVLTAAGMKKMAVFWDVARCSLVEIFQHFGGSCCRHHQGDKYAMRKELAGTSETSVTFHQTNRCNGKILHGHASRNYELMNMLLMFHFYL